MRKSSFILQCQGKKAEDLLFILLVEMMFSLGLICGFLLSRISATVTYGYWLAMLL